jgi:Asp-tRNA(Asn)/Glu-tRNA(Gln) amidotransferase A subunit family amidase
MDQLIYASATSLAQAIRDKKVSSQEVVEAYCLVEAHFIDRDFMMELSIP